MMSARTFLLFPTILLLTYASLYPITGTLHNQLIKKEEQFTSRLLKTEEERAAMDLSLNPPSPRIERKHGRHRRYKKKEPKKKTFSKMAYKELVEAKNKQLEAGNRDIATKYLEQIIKLCDDINKLAKHLVELADLFFDSSKFEKAGKIYTEFTMLYPGNNQIEYALYRAILCSFRQTLSADRDQTKTEETLKLIDNFLDRVDIFSKYKAEVYHIQESCYQKLVASEIGICTFYINKKSYRPAQKYLDGLHKQWLPKMPVIESQVIMLEIALAEKKGDTKIALEKQQELKKKYPNEIIMLAENKQKITMASRF